MSNETQITTQTEFHNRLTRVNLKLKRIRTLMTYDENRKNPCFAFLKISTNVHLQSHISQPSNQALQKSAILPAFK